VKPSWPLPAAAWSFNEPRQYVASDECSLLPTRGTFSPCLKRKGERLQPDGVQVLRCRFFTNSVERMQERAIVLPVDDSKLFINYNRVQRDRRRQIQLHLYICSRCVLLQPCMARHVYTCTCARIHRL